MSKIIEPSLLNWNIQNGCDTGGMTIQWLIAQNRSSDFPSCIDIRHSTSDFHTDHIYFIKHLWSNTWKANELPGNLSSNSSLISFLQNDPRNLSDLFFCELYDDVFLHFRSGSSSSDKSLFTSFVRDFLSISD